MMQAQKDKQNAGGGGGGMGGKRPDGGVLVYAIDVVIIGDLVIDGKCRRC